MSWLMSLLLGKKQVAIPHMSPFILGYCNMQILWALDILKAHNILYITTQHFYWYLILEVWNTLFIKWLWFAVDENFQNDLKTIVA